MHKIIVYLIIFKIELENYIYIKFQLRIIKYYDIIKLIFKNCFISKCIYMYISFQLLI